MLYHMLLLLPIWFSNGNHQSQNLSDVIITYSNHADAEPEAKPKPNVIKPVKIMVPERFITEKTDPQVFIRQRPEKEMETAERVSDEVVFIPNEKNERELIRNEDYLMQHPLKMTDYFGKRTVNDVMESNVMLATEPPSDIIFLSGRNDHNENIKGMKQPFDATTTEKAKALNCSNLDCNNTVSSVCGGKVEHKQWRYRLFLNDCYFRKVNCYFTHEENRFHLLPLKRCSSIGFHVATQPSPFHLFPMDFMFKHHQRQIPQPVNNTKRVSGRRSLFKGLAGKACDHTCPPTCPEDYAPECAVSSNGQRRVFVNHCKLDWNSCTFRIAWYKRPLSECIGGKKADMRQNRGFIDWMQRVGIIDNKGRLVLN